MAPRKPHIDDFPALGFIPCPGDQEAIETVSDAFGLTAEALREVNAVLTGADEGEWRGLTAIAFRDMLHGDFQPKIETARDSFVMASEAISDWLDRMRTDQDYARLLEEEAATAVQNRDTAQTTLGNIPESSEPSGDEEETDEERREREQNDQDREDAQAAYNDAVAALEDVRGRAQDLKDSYIEDGNDIASRFRDAIDLAPDEPGFWGKVGEAIGEFFGAMMDLIEDFGEILKTGLAAMAPALNIINGVLGLLATGIGIASLFFPALAPLALGLGAVVLATTYLQKVGETGSFVDAMKDPSVIAAAAGVVFGGTTRLLGNAVPALSGVGMVSRAGFTMTRSGTYLAAGATRAQYVYNAATAGGIGTELFNTFQPNGHVTNIRSWVGGEVSAEPNRDVGLVGYQSQN